MAHRGSSRKGFTLIELVVALIVVVVVVAGVWATLDFGNRTTVTSEQRATIQFETRYAASELKSAIGVATSVTIYATAPTAAEIATFVGQGYGYADYDAGNGWILLHKPGAATSADQKLLQRSRFDQSGLTSLPSMTVSFSPQYNAAGTYAKIVVLEVAVGNYQIDTDIFAQNMASGTMSIATVPASTPGPIVTKGPFLLFK